jgi:hypothetical protein
MGKAFLCSLSPRARFFVSISYVFLGNHLLSLWPLDGSLLSMCSQASMVTLFLFPEARFDVLQNTLPISPKHNKELKRLFAFFLANHSTLRQFWAFGVI